MAEHSRLVYLLDALRCVMGGAQPRGMRLREPPACDEHKNSNKVVRLLQIAFPKPEASQRYVASWNRLSEAFWEERLARECGRLRDDLR